MACELQGLGNLYPGRYLVVVLDPEHGQAPSAWYRLATIPQHPEKLGSEVIALHCSDPNPLPSLLASLAKADQPRFLWWRGTPPYQESWFRQLIESQQRIIFDSGGYGVLRRPMGNVKDVKANLQHIHQLINDPYHQELVFSDLNWGRVQAWREWLAGLFDSPDRLAELARLQKIEIVSWAQARDITPSLHALYIAGWLTHQLRLKITGHIEQSANEEGQSATLLGRNGPIQIDFRYQAARHDELTARLARVSFIGPGYRWSVERNEENAGVLQRSFTSDEPVGNAKPSPCLELKQLDTLHLLSQELDSYLRDSVFENALSRALEL